MLKVLKRAEIEPWPNLFSNERKSAITDLLQDGHDVVDVTAWVGNSPNTIWDFYAMATGENRRRAAGGGRADGRRTATQTGKHCPADAADLWTSLWTHQGQSVCIHATQENGLPQKTSCLTGSDEKTWALRDSNVATKTTRIAGPNRMGRCRRLQWRLQFNLYRPSWPARYSPSLDDAGPFGGTPILRP